MAVNSEKLKNIHEFCDGMAEKEVHMAKVALPKWLIQGFLYGLVLGVVMYFAGAVAVNAIPTFLPAATPTISGALGFLSSLGIAYTNDITQ
ncbi:MAG: hypothetical protein U9P49_06375 [Thermodesulfobacteriota bacterium]|nr:hypothetical protein [Thermodesulfobacteriota bacterium]